MSSTYQVITTNEQLANYCATVKKHLAVDTEFIRTRTFYPILGLIQLYDGESVALVDPINITEWGSFITLLKDPQIQKYLHACSEDIDLFLHYFNVIPTPLIDSQILASFLDNPLSSGYASLVKKYLDVDLDKSEVRTDWLQRPLTDKQLSYAVNDVLYLLPLMEKLKSELFDRGWLNAAYNECELVIDRKKVKVDPTELYQQIKNSWQLDGIELGRLQSLAKWRYNLATREDIALNFVIHEELLWKIARYKPTSLAELTSLGVKGKEIRLYGKTILSILAETSVELPTIKRINHYPHYKRITEELKSAAESIAKEQGLNSELLLSRRFINHYVKWWSDKTEPVPEILTGWRKSLFEKKLENK